jgi:hypothetical protein
MLFEVPAESRRQTLCAGLILLLVLVAVVLI